MTELAWVLTCGTIGAAAIWVGHRIGYANGLADGKLAISATHAYDSGRKAGQRETADFLSGSEIPAVRNVGRALQADGWGR